MAVGERSSKMLTFVVLLGTLASSGFCVNLTQYSQKDYIVKTERFEYIESNDNYLENFRMKSFKYNRTHFGMNCTGSWKVDMHAPVMITAQGYKFVSNEYRLVAFHFPFDICDVIQRNIFGLKSLNDCGTTFRCPMKKGPFTVCNWNPDYTKFPPNVPRGRYMMQLEWKKSGIKILTFNWYLEVQDVPLPY